MGGRNRNDRLHRVEVGPHVMTKKLGALEHTGVKLCLLSSAVVVMFSIAVSLTRCLSRELRPTFVLFYFLFFFWRETNSVVGQIYAYIALDLGTFPCPWYL